MLNLRKSRYTVRIANDRDDIAAAQRLRYLAFVSETGALARKDGLDAEDFDALCYHVLIEDRKSGAVFGF